MSTSKEIASDQGSPTASIGSTESLGTWLARTRVSLGAEPRDMARHLGLNPTIILALEADDFARLDVQRHIFQDAQLAVARFQIANFKHDRPPNRRE